MLRDGCAEGRVRQFRSRSWACNSARELRQMGPHRFTRLAFPRRRCSKNLVVHLVHDGFQRRIAVDDHLEYTGECEGVWARAVMEMIPERLEKSCERQEHSRRFPGSRIPGLTEF
ncbi:hypothetical protein Mapa_010396 [Marchantia paleacea]|nr:hypothetical protein Mapa_010396 [Marchantia paleacea]